MYGRKITKEFVNKLNKTKLQDLCKKPGTFLSILNSESNNQLRFYLYGRYPIETIKVIGPKTCETKIKDLENKLGLETLPDNKKLINEKEFQYYLAGRLNIKSHSYWNCLCPEYGICNHYNKKGNNADRVGRQDLILIHKDGHILFIELKVFENDTYKGESGVKKHLEDFAKIDANWDEWNLDKDLQDILTAHQMLNIYKFKYNKQIIKPRKMFIFVTVFSNQGNEDDNDKYIKKMDNEFKKYSSMITTTKGLHDTNIKINPEKYHRYYIPYTAGANDQLFHSFVKIVLKNVENNLKNNNI